MSASFEGRGRPRCRSMTTGNRGPCPSAGSTATSWSPSGQRFSFFCSCAWRSSTRQGTSRTCAPPPASRARSAEGAGPSSHSRAFLQLGLLPSYWRASPLSILELLARAAPHRSAPESVDVHVATARRGRRGRLGLGLRPPVLRALTRPGRRPSHTARVASFPLLSYKKSRRVEFPKLSPFSGRVDPIVHPDGAKLRVPSEPAPHPCRSPAERSGPPAMSEPHTFPDIVEDGGLSRRNGIWNSTCPGARRCLDAGPRAVRGMTGGTELPER